MTAQLSKDEMSMRVVRTPAGGWKYCDEVYHPRFLARIKRRVVIDANGCWLWQGTVHPRGYGQTNYRGRTVNVHRAVYVATHGVKLAFAQQVCHSCDVKICCNPAHLWLGSNKDNHIDKIVKGRNYFSNLTHCKRGHEFAPENVRWRKSYGNRGPARVCKTCERDRHRGLI